MEWSYEYTPFIWPLLASAILAMALGIFAFRNRAVPGATPFVFLLAIWFSWLMANALKLTAAGDETRILWSKIETAIILPGISAALCFALEYSGLGKWLNLRTILLLAVLPLAAILLILTNDMHHLIWKRIWFDGYVQTEIGPVHWAAIVYGYFLSLLHLIVLAWLFVRSPRHRWIAAGLIIAPFIVRVAYFFRIANWNPVAPLDPLVVAVNFTLLLYALALFPFHMFDAVPVARDTVIEKMPDGMMVLDGRNRVIDMNRRAETLLGIARSKAIGGSVVEVLQAYPDLLRLLQDSGGTHVEGAFENTHGRWVQVSLSSLIGRHGFHLGRLVWLHDMTERKRAQEQILDQQRTLAMLKERELLARELHDGVGQMLAAVHLQTKSASELLARGEKALAESCLRRVAQTTQEAKESIRNYLRGVKAGSPNEQGLVPSLRDYLKRYSRDYGIRTELIVHPELEAQGIAAAVEVQLQPIIQEALTNARTHGMAGLARVAVALEDAEVCVTIEDDGRGFDPGGLDHSQWFGIRSMQGRAGAVGGRLEVDSAAGKGTRVIVRVPRGKGKM